MANCMRFDPRRRFALGFTIENTDMTLWYCDRAQLIVSERFDFCKVSVDVENETSTHVYIANLEQDDLRSFPPGRLVRRALSSRVGSHY